jgi:hypothetical protein
VATRLLDQAAFRSTFTAKMHDVTTSTTNVIDIWPYVTSIPEADLEGHKVAPGVVDHVYRTSENTFDHVMVVTNSSNVYLVVVVDLVADSVHGHCMLNLNKEYGLDE